MNDTVRLYGILHNMRSRCYLPTFSRYEYYGKRGIKICDEWLGRKGFKNFYNWAMKNGYQSSLTIDRIDNEKDYCPDNCRWVSMLIQNNNTSKNHYITHNGETKTASQWAKIYNINRNTLNKRIRRGWSFESAVSTPVRRFISYNKSRKNNLVLSSKDVNINQKKEESDGQT